MQEHSTKRRKTVRDNLKNNVLVQQEGEASHGSPKDLSRNIPLTCGLSLKFSEGYNKTKTKY